MDFGFQRKNYQFIKYYLTKIWFHLISHLHNIVHMLFHYIRFIYYDVMKLIDKRICVYIFFPIRIKLYFFKKHKTIFLLLNNLVGVLQRPLLFDFCHAKRKCDPCCVLLFYYYYYFNIKSKNRGRL